MSGNENARRPTRRRVLSTVAGTGVAAAFGSLTSKYGVADASGLESADEIPLGTAESPFGEWRADGDLALTRVGRDERPMTVTGAEFALEAVVDGDPAPSISRPIADVALSTNPYFVADVTPGRIDGTDAPVAFRFRLYRPTDPLEDRSSREPAAESEPVTVPQATPGRIYWDASDVDFGLLDAVSRLEIGWHPADRDPESSGGAFAYRGSVVLDAVRATATNAPVGRARLAATMRDLQFEHGAYVRTEVTESFDGGEAGAFVFADGSTEPYRVEALASGRVLFAVADAAVELGGGRS